MAFGRGMSNPDSRRCQIKQWSINEWLNYDRRVDHRSDQTTFREAECPGKDTSSSAQQWSRNVFVSRRLLDYNSLEERDTVNCLKIESFVYRCARGGQGEQMCKLAQPTLGRI